MAKVKSTKKKEKRKFLTTLNENNVTEINIFNYCKDIMMVYGGNVNIARAIPDLRDSNKPIERRVMYSMYKDLNMKPKTKKKVSQIVGIVMGKYSPHGDLSIVESIVGMGQWFTTPITLIKKQGNYGSIVRGEHSAARYIEAGITEFAYDNFFSEWTPNITEMMPNYTGESVEPEYLPSKVPLLLMKSIFGLGFGASTGIPYFNPNEVIDLTLKLLKNPNSRNVFLVPDSPTGCPVVDNDWKTVCETGRGTLTYRGEAEIEDNIIRITNIPHITSTGKIMDTLIGYMKDKSNPLESIVNIEDNSEETDYTVDFALEIHVKKGYSPEQVLDFIYKNTMLQTSITVKFDVVYDFENFHMSLKALILNWITFRRETKKRILSNNYSNTRKEIHLCEAVIKILTKKNGDEKLFKLIRKCNNRSSVIESLIKTFDLTDIQAEMIADMKFYSLSKDSLQSYKDRLKIAKEKEIYIKKYMFDDELVDEEIVEELKEFKKKYGHERKSPVLQIADAKREIANSEHTIIITKKGYIKKMGEEFTGTGKLTKDDVVKHIIKVNNRKSLLLFTDHGKSYNLDVNDIPDTGTGSGILLSTLIKTASNKIVAVLEKIPKKVLEKEEHPIYVVFVTKNGLVKKSLLSEYYNSTSSGILSISLKTGDTLVSVTVMKGDKEIAIYTNKGHYIKFDTEEITPTLRNSKGVIGITIKEKSDHVIGMDIINKDKDYLVIITDTGLGKKCLLRNFDKGKRTDKGSVLTKLEDNEEIAVVKAYQANDNVYVYTTENKVKLPLDDIPELIKLSRGKKVIGLKKGEKIIDIE